MFFDKLSRQQAAMLSTMGVIPILSALCVKSTTVAAILVIFGAAFSTMCFLTYIEKCGKALRNDEDDDIIFLDGNPPFPPFKKPPLPPFTSSRSSRKIDVIDYELLSKE